MSGFSAASVAALSYDFTSFPQDDGEGRCTGKGVIPEPTKAKLRAFYEGFDALMQRDVDAEPPSEDEIKALAAEMDEKVYGLLSGVCSGKPSVEELKQLPPRILSGFTRYIMESLAPKA